MRSKNKHLRPQLQQWANKWYVEEQYDSVSDISGAEESMCTLPIAPPFAVVLMIILARA